MNKIFTWEFVIAIHVLLLVAFLLTGCASYVSATVGDHTVRTGFHLNHIEATNNDA